MEVLVITSALFCTAPLALASFPARMVKTMKESNRLSLGFVALTPTHQKSQTSLLSRAPESGTNTPIPLVLLLFPSRHAFSVLKGQKMSWASCQCLLIKSNFGIPVMSSPALIPYPSALFLLQILGSALPSLLNCHLSSFNLEFLCQLTAGQGPRLIAP